MQASVHKSAMDWTYRVLYVTPMYTVISLVDKLHLQHKAVSLCHL